MKSRPTEQDIKKTTAYQQNKANAALFSEVAVKESAPQDKTAGIKGKPANKYRNQKVTIDGETIDSKREAKRWLQLKLRQRAGELIFLARQVTFELNAGGAFSYTYRADFVYMEKGNPKIIVEDAKGFSTRDYLKKKKLMKEIHSIEIKEV